MKPLLSIIVPVYNTGSCLRRCLDSIIKQLYKNWELIVVNDGSTDNSREILEMYSQIDKRIKLINIKNSGVSVARNIGISSAKGDYIGFVDSDDWISEKMYLKMCESVYLEDYDIVQCSYALINYRDETEEKIENKDNVEKSYYENRQLLSAYFKGDVSPSVCNKIFKRSMIEGLLFDTETKIGEDSLFVYRCCQKSSKAFVMKDIFYYYYQTPDSAMRSALSCNNFQPLKIFEMQMEEYRGEGEIYSLIAQRKVYFCIDLLLRIFESSNCTEQISQLCDEIKKHKKDIFINKHSIKIKFATFMVSINPKIFAKLYKIVYLNK